MKKFAYLLLPFLLVGCANTPIGDRVSRAVAPQTIEVGETIPPDFPFPVLENAQLLDAEDGRVVFRAANGTEALNFYRSFFDGQEWSSLVETESQIIRFNAQFLATIAVNREEVTINYVELQGRIAIPEVRPPEPAPETAPPLAQPDRHIADLQRLAIVPQDFQPNATIARREFARLLVTANNRLFQDRPAQQIRPALPGRETAIFTDVPQTDPDFGFIQGLANAGIIDRGVREFQPDRPLTREVMVQWKVPLDIRRPVPPASSAAVQTAWNFQDAGRISPAALGAVLQDSRSGELSNIRRSFGFTTLFQPQKHVSRLEAATALWYFGDGETGISAQEVQNP